MSKTASSSELKPSKLLTKQSSPDRKTISELFTTILDKTRRADIDIKIEFPEYLPIKQTFEILENFADDETKLRLEESALKILEKIEELPNYQINHRSKSVDKFERYISSSIKKLVDAASMFVFSVDDGKLQRCTPSWNIPMRDTKISKQLLDQRVYEFRKPGKTTGEIFIKQKEWLQRELPADTGFIIGIVNCDTVDEEDSRVSEKTLENASTDDLEVFDTIHELERIYGEEAQNISLSTIKIRKDDLTIESDNRTAERILGHVAKRKESGQETSSIAIFIVSESFNLSNKPLKSIEDIYSHIPFRQLKEMGVEDVLIDVVSCNTAEIASDIIDLTQKQASDNHLRISSVFHNGYIFNNITYCYLGKAEYKDLIERNKSPNEFYESPESSPKSKQLVQIITPGLSNIFSNRISDYTTTKEVAHKSKKCLVPTKIPLITHGSSFIYSADGRTKFVEVGNETAAALKEDEMVTKK